MARTNERLIALYKEVAALLSNKGVPHCAAEWFAWRACLPATLPATYTEISLMVPHEAIEHILSFETDESRRFVAARPDAYTHETLRYVDCTTLLINAGWHDQLAPGLSVRLVPVRKEDGKWRVDVWDTGCITLDANPLSHCRVTLCDGVRVSVPADYETYFEVLLGASWRSKYARPVPTLAYGTILNLDTPYENYLAKAQQDGSYNPAFADEAVHHRWPHKSAFSVSELSIEDVSAYRSWYGHEFSENEAAVEDMIQRHRLLVHRFKQCERYLPHKQLLLEQWRSGDKKLVEKSMGAYLKELLVFYERGLVLHFDNELFELALAILREQGWEHVEELADMVPSRYIEEELSATLASYVQ